MKRIITLCLVLSLCAALTGCGRGSTAPTESAAISPPAQQETKPESPQAQLLPEQVIFDSDGLRITVKGMEEDTMAGTRIRLLVENGTQKNIVLSGDLFVVNGVTMPGYLYAEAAAGTKTNDAIELYGDSLEAAGIVEIQTLRGYDVRIVDTDTYETLTQVPMELETAYNQGPAFVPGETGVELYKTEGITVIAQVISEEFYGKTARLLVNNELERDIIVEAEHISVNGYTVDAWLYDTVCAETLRYCQLDLFETGLAENGIDQIETVTFTLNLLDAETYETIARSDALTVNVSG